LPTPTPSEAEALLPHDPTVAPLDLQLPVLWSTTHPPRLLLPVPLPSSRSGA
jgi:hypothetical protein